MKKLITTLGPLTETQLGLVLPHEHIFVDLGPREAESYRHADPGEVVRAMRPEIERIKAQGVTALVECTPVGVGRRADIIRAVSTATAFPVVMPTGIYREPWVPRWAHEAGEEALATWMLGELTGEVEASGVQAAWIKVSVGDDGITPCETKILRAAARAGAATGAVIGSHTVRGRVVRDQLDILEAAGYTAERFIWILPFDASPYPTLEDALAALDRGWEHAFRRHVVRARRQVVDPWGYLISRHASGTLMLASADAGREVDFLAEAAPAVLSSWSDLVYLTDEEAKAVQRHLRRLVAPSGPAPGKKRYVLRLGLAPSE